MTFIITVNGSIKQTSESTPNLSVLPKPLSYLLDARALEIQDGAFATNFIAGGTWDSRLRTMQTIMQDTSSASPTHKYAPIFSKTGGYAGNPCLHFEGENNIRSGTINITVPKIAVATLVRIEHYRYNGRVAYLGSTATNRRGIQVGTSGVSAIYGSSNINSNEKPNDWVVQISYFDGANSKLIIDDQIFEGETTGTETFNCITMGGDNIGTTAFFGDISYLAVYEGELTTVQLLEWAKEIKLMFS